MGLRDAVARKAARWEAKERADNKLEVTKKIAKFLRKMKKFLEDVNEFDSEVALASGMGTEPYFCQLARKGTMTISVKDSMNKRPAMVRVNTKKYLALGEDGIAQELKNVVNRATLIDDEKLKRKIVRIFAIIKAILKHDSQSIGSLNCSDKKADSLRKEHDKLNKSVLKFEKEYFKDVAGIMSINEKDKMDIVGDDGEKRRTIMRNKRSVTPSGLGEVNDNLPNYEILLRQLKTLRKNVYRATIRKNIAGTAISEVKEMKDRFKLLKEELDKDFRAINSIMSKKAEKKHTSSEDYMKKEVFVGFGEGTKSYSGVISHIEKSLEELEGKKDSVVSAEGKLRELTNRDDAEIFEIDLRKDKKLSEEEKEAKCKGRYQEIKRCNEALEGCKEAYVESRATVGGLLNIFEEMPSSKEYKKIRRKVGHFSRARVGIKKSELEAEAKKAEAKKAEAKKAEEGTNNTPPTEPIPAPVPPEAVGNGAPNQAGEDGVPDQAGEDGASAVNPSEGNLPPEVPAES